LLDVSLSGFDAERPLADAALAFADRKFWNVQPGGVITPA
jgi:hypothetical protein